MNEIEIDIHKNKRKINFDMVNSVSPRENSRHAQGENFDVESSNVANNDNIYDRPCDTQTGGRGEEEIGEGLTLEKGEGFRMKSRKDEDADKDEDEDEYDDELDVSESSDNNESNSEELFRCRRSEGAQTLRTGNVIIKSTRTSDGHDRTRKNTQKDVTYKD